MQYFIPTLTLTLLNSFLAFSAPNPSNDIAARDDIPESQLEAVASRLEIGVFEKASCGGAETVVGAVHYNNQEPGTVMSYMLSRDLLPAEQLDFSNAEPPKDAKSSPGVVSAAANKPKSGASRASAGTKRGLWSREHVWKDDPACKVYNMSAIDGTRAGIKGGPMPNKFCYSLPGPMSCFRLWRRAD